MRVQRKPSWTAVAFCQWCVLGGGGGGGRGVREREREREMFIHERKLQTLNRKCILIGIQTYNLFNNIDYFRNRNRGGL